MNKKDKKSFFGVKNAGFTLIELLVVVLIVGILSAVALPQYQKSVEKARTVEGLALLRSFKTAQESFYIANSVYADSFDKLDLDFLSTPKNFVWETHRFAVGRFALSHKDKGYTLVASGDYRSDGGPQGIFYCCALNDPAEQLCKSLGRRITNSLCALAYQIQ